MNAGCSGLDIIEELGDEMDIMDDPFGVRWRCYLSPRAYQLLKEDRSREEILGLSGPDAEWIYEKEGEEYVKVWDNERIPFRIHMRIAGIVGRDRDDADTYIEARREIDRR